MNFRIFGNSYIVRLLRRVSLSGVGGTACCNILTILGGIGTGVTLARSLGPAGRGELSAATLWPAIAALVGDLGLGFAFSYYIGKFSHKKDELWTLLWVIGSLSGGLVALFGWLILPALDLHLTARTLDGMRIVFLSVPARILSAYLCYMLLGASLIADYNIARLIQTATYLLAVLAVYAAGQASVHAYSIAYDAGMFGGLVASAVIVVSRMRPKVRWSWGLIPGLFSYGLRSLVSNLAYETNNSLDQAVLSIMATPAELGQYTVAVPVSGVLGPFLSALSTVILPRTTGSPDPKTGALRASGQIKIAVLLSLPVLVVSMCLMPVVLPRLYGNKYAPAILPAQILLAAGMFQGLNGVFGNALRGLGRPSQPAIAQALGVALTVLSLFALLPALGIVGASIASLLAYSSITFLQFQFLAKTGGMKATELMTARVNFRAVDRLRQLLPAWIGGT